MTVQPLCRRHARELLKQVLRMTKQDPWKPALEACNQLLFQLQYHDPRIVDRCGGQTENLSQVLAEIGAPCCSVWLWQWKLVCRVMKRGAPHARAVAARTVTDPDFEQAIALMQRPEVPDA
ncbi:MAG: hypothetical protein V4617_15220 [Gemmatimonadota bacterium]